jgi:hypothetical protein
MTGVDTSQGAMRVRRLADERGSYIDPPLDQEWDALTKLRWHLAVTLQDSGLAADALQIDPADYRVGGVAQDGYYCLHGLWFSVGALSYSSAWDVINGIEYGARLTRG